MIKKLTLIAGVGVGYVLGTKAGRERYDDLVVQFQKITGTPQAKKVSDTLHQAAGDLADKATAAAGSATDAVKDKAPTTATTAPVTTSSAPLPGSAPRAGSLDPR